MMNTPSTPVLMGELPMRQKRITPANGPAGVMPTKVGGLLPHKTIRGSLPNKMVDWERSVSPNDNIGEHEDRVASAKDREGHEDDGLSQGEDKVDEMQDEAQNEAPMRWRTQVAIQDQKEHILLAGKWAGLGAIQKANEVCVNVSGTENGSLNWINHCFPGPTHIPHHYMQPVCQR